MTNERRNDDSFNIDQNFDDCSSQNYDIVTFDIRVKLIKLVCGQNYKISRAARALNVNQSTAKYIVRTFRKKGKILMKFQKNKAVDEDAMQELQELKRKYKVSNSSFQQEKGRKRKSGQKLKMAKHQSFQKQVTIVSNQKQQNNIERNQEFPKQNFQSCPYPLVMNSQIMLVPFYFDPVSQIAWAPMENNYI